MKDYRTERLEQLNRETQAYRARQVDRYNPSTRGNYNTVDFNKLNRVTYSSNNYGNSHHPTNPRGYTASELYNKWNKF